MAFSLVNGLLNQAWPAAQICVADVATEQLEKFRALNVRTFTDNSAAIDGAAAIVLAVKPQIAAMVCEALALQPAQLLVSIAAGINCQSLSIWTTEAQPIVRCMPNTPALLGQGATALYATKHCTQEQKHLAQSILDAAGTTQWVDEESKLDAVTAVSGSGPAYFFALMEAMIEAGCELGLSREMATQLTIQTAAGAAAMAQMQEDSPAQLRENVTSPGGTTQAALTHMSDAGMAQIIKGALTAARDRAEALAIEFGAQPQDVDRKE